MEYFYPRARGQEYPLAIEALLNAYFHSFIEDYYDNDRYLKHDRPILDTISFDQEER
jgi:hypothetical protein